MATKKTFNNILMEANASVYSKSVYSLVMVAKNASGVEFKPVLQPNGKVDATTSKYTVQRRVRPTVKAVANATAGTTAAAMAMLDGFSEATYDAIDIATGALQAVGFKELIADDFDFGNSPKHQKDLKAIVGEVAASRHKKILELIKTAPKTGTALPAYADGKTEVWNALSGESARLAKVDDAYLDVQHKTDFYHVISEDVATELSQEMGKAFNQEAPIAQTGFKSNMQVNGVPVIVDARLTGRQAFTIHNDAIGFNKVALEKDIAVDLGLVAFTGKAFWDVMAIVDTARISQFGTTTK